MKGFALNIKMIVGFLIGLTLMFLLSETFEMDKSIAMFIGIFVGIFIMVKV